jgi:predicted amidohydrolase
LKTHLVQKDVRNADLAPILDRALEAGAGLVCFNELATSGCLYGPREVASLEDHLSLLRKYDLRMMVGLPLKTDEGLCNTYLYYHRGKFQLYLKTKLFPLMNEPETFLPGSKPGVWSADFGRVGIAICYELRFPEVFEDLVKAEVETIFVPAAFPLVRINDWKDLLVQRARETHKRIVGINAVGDDGTNVFGGATMLVSPDGEILAQADESSETVLEIEL